VAAVRGDAAGAALGGERGAGRGVSGARGGCQPRPLRARARPRSLARALPKVPPPPLHSIDTFGPQYDLQYQRLDNVSRTKTQLKYGTSWDSIFEKRTIISI
jgi:hypothetical protein